MSVLYAFCILQSGIVIVLCYPPIPTPDTDHPAAPLVNKNSFSQAIPNNICSILFNASRSTAYPVNIDLCKSFESLD